VRRIQKTWILAALWLMSVSAAALAQSGPPVKLRYAFTAGQKFAIRQIEINDDVDKDIAAGAQSASQKNRTIDMFWEVLAVAPNGDATLSWRYEYLRLALTAGGGTVVLDTRRSAAEANPAFAQNPEMKPMLDNLEMTIGVIKSVFLGTPIKFQVDPQGKVKKVEGFDVIWDEYREVAAKIFPDLSQRAELDAMIEGLFGEKTSRQTLAFMLFIPYPAAVSAGGEWNDRYEFEVGQFRLPVSRTFRLEDPGAGGAPARINIKQVFGKPPKTEEAEFEIIESLINGEAVVDSKTGTIRKMTYGGTLVMEIYALSPGAPRSLVLQTTSRTEGSVEFARK
jgi:hypothetical protein